VSDLAIRSRPGIAAALSTFLTAVVLLMVSNGRFPVAICAWLGPLFMLRFTRTGKRLIRLPLAYLGMSFAFGFQFYGIVPFGTSAFLIFCAAFGITLLLPYLADCFLATRWQGLARSLIFPLALVVSEYFASLGPFGSWGSLAYTQYEHLALLQLVSVTGIYGITFLIGWFAAVGNSLWEVDFAVRQALRESLAFALIFAAVLLFGDGRMAMLPPQSSTIRVASITRPDENLFPYPPGADLNKRVMMGEPLTDAETAQLHQRSNSIADFLLGRADLEAQAGARVITFGELNFPVLKQYKADLIQQSSELAKRRGIYIALPLAVFDIGHKPSLEDKLVMIDPSGQTEREYRKSQITPGLEVAILAPTTGIRQLCKRPSGGWARPSPLTWIFPAFCCKRAASMRI
jgi:apolipoprotein N-acyltransferase